MCVRPDEHAAAGDGRRVGEGQQRADGSRMRVAVGKKYRCVFYFLEKSRRTEGEA
jgi:hypothetical protein